MISGRFERVAVRARFGLQNRCTTAVLSRPKTDFPRDAGLSGQSGTRRTRDALRFAPTQQMAQSVRESFARLKCPEAPSAVEVCRGLGERG